MEQGAVLIRCIIDEENTEDENKNDEVIEEETEEFILETENRGIIDNNPKKFRYISASEIKYKE